MQHQTRDPQIQTRGLKVVSRTSSIAGRRFLRKPKGKLIMAPDITTKRLAAYLALARAADCPQNISGPMIALCTMVQKFRETPNSKLSGKTVSFPSLNRNGTEIPLEPDEIARMDEYIPYADELEMWAKRFEAIPDSDLRNAAFHLLWFAVELSKDREPITREKLMTADEL